MAKYNDLTQGQIEAMVNKLGGMEGVKNFLSGKTVIANPEDVRVKFEVFRTVRIGTRSNIFDLIENVRIPDKSIMACRTIGALRQGRLTFEVSKIEEDIQLCKVTVSQLGFDNQPTYEEICARAEQLGLELCSQEVALQLHLQWDKECEDVYVATNPMTVKGYDCDDEPLIFGLTKHGGIWLKAIATPMGFPTEMKGLGWNKFSRFIFQLRK